MNVDQLPALNAGLNALATVCMTCGFVWVSRARRCEDLQQRQKLLLKHRACMLGAGGASAVFLLCYVLHKILVRGVHTPFGGSGFVAGLYYVMLFTHIVLAIAIAYLVPRTFLLALRGEHERHRRWARWTFPIWYYVSITGVLVYFSLYHWWPATPHP